MYNKICQYCKHEFQSNHPAYLYCSEACKIEYKRPGRVENCLECNNKIERIRKSAKFCSVKCRRKFEYKKLNPFLKKNCKICNKEFKTRKETTMCCSRSCANKTWVHKLKKEKVVKMCKNCQKTYEVYPSAKDKRICCSKSCAAAFRMRSGQHFEQGSYYSTKTRRNVKYRSSWEKTLMENLDKNNSILSYLHEPMAIQFKFKNKDKNYIPDFLIYSTKNIKLIELKPKKFLKTEENQAKFKAAREFCKERGIIFEIWTEKDYVEKSQNEDL